MTGIRVFLSTSGSPTHFPVPTFTEVTSLLLAEGGANISQGVAGRGQEWAAGSFSFTLRNTAGTYSGPALLRRPVLLRVSVGASDIDIRGVITDITEYRDGVRRLQISGTDTLGLVGDLEVGQTWTEQLAAQSARSWWPLNEDGRDALVTGDATNVYPLTEDPPRNNAGAFIYGGDQSGQRPVHGAIEGCPALSGGGVTLEPTGTTGFAGLYGAVAPPGRASYNMLTANQSSVETDTTGFTSATCNIARSTAQAAHGTSSLSMSATTATFAYLSAGTDIGTSGVRVQPGVSYSATASVRAATTARATEINLVWYNAAGAYISYVGATGADNNTGWTTLSKTGVAPANAAYAAVLVIVYGQAIGEVHYVDQWGLWEGTALGPWLHGGPNPWTVSGWIRRMSGGSGIALSVVMSDGYWLGFGFSTDNLLIVLTPPGGETSMGAVTPGQTDWYWFTLGASSAGKFFAGTRDARGRTVAWYPGHNISGHTPLSPPSSLIVGGPASIAAPYWPAHCQVADLTWSLTQAPAPWYSSPLMYGHIGYPGESVQARGDRLLTEAGIIPAAGTWNGTAPPEGPTLADEPLTRRPLADALNATLDSGGFVIHDLPATSTADTSVGLLWPDALDGVGVTPTVYAGKRVLLASDGVATTTGMLTNAATVTNGQRQTTYEDAASVATYGRRAAMVTSQTEDTQAGRDYDASHASWLASREASPAQALGLPDLVLDVDGMIADGDTAKVVAMARTGACLSIANLLPGGGTYSGIVRGLQWEHTTQGALRLTLRCQPLRPLPYAVTDDAATATLDNVIVGW